MMRHLIAQVFLFAVCSTPLTLAFSPYSRVSNIPISVRSLPQKQQQQQQGQSGNGGIFLRKVEERKQQRRRGDSTSVAAGPSPDVVLSQQKTAVAGKLLPFLTQMSITEHAIENMYATLAHTVHLGEFTAICLIAWGTLPFIQFMYSIMTKNNIYAAPDYKHHWWYHMINGIVQAFKIGSVVYGIDIIAIVLHSIGFEKLNELGISHKAGMISIVFWLMMRCKMLKSYFLFRGIERNAKTSKVYARTRLLDRLIDLVLYFYAGIIVIHRLKMKFGVTLSSIAAFGGMGTLIFSLASKDLAGQFLSTLAIKLSIPFIEGDSVNIGGSTNGKVQRIGWLSTDLRKGDEVITTIPNSKIANQAIENVSRITLCSVKQTLKFRYEDISKIPNLLKTIKEEIRESCPTLITDGSRPFRAHWRDYERDCLSIVVECHFNQPPSNDKYWNTRQTMLEAIGRAVNKEQVKFAPPPNN